MAYLLDTNHCVYLKNAFFKRKERRTTFEANAIKMYEAISVQEIILVSEVSLGELYFGAEKSEYKEKNYNKVEFLKKKIQVQYLDDETWRLFAKTKVTLIKEGKGITDFDLLIACAAKSHNHVLVSNDSDHKVIPEDFEIANWVL